MQFRTEIEKMPSKQPINCRDGIFVLGSCFADNIGTWLKQSCLNVCCNPFGVLYNPASIAKHFYSHHYIIEQAPDGMFYSFSHHGKHYATTSEELIQNLEKVRVAAEDALDNAKHILITFGTSWVYERNGAIVANCHKFPAKEFTRRRLSVEEIVSMWIPIIEKIGDKHIIFTVSPIRHVKDSLHGNQLSKAVLLLSIDRLCSLFPDKVEYLPIYELLIDDLRDYRFYADDLVHPGSLAIEIVKQYFSENCLDAECREFIKDVTPIVKGMNHVPLHPESEAHAAFLSQKRLKIEQLEKKYNIFGLSKILGA